jgi:hypothetical protein
VRGAYVVLVSDDVLVPSDFLDRHIETLMRFPGHWIVGGFRQLDSLTETPFGRYIDGLERSFDAGRRGKPVEDGVWEMTVPTARNLSLPRQDLERTGLFDEQFQSSCEDQDLAHRARDVGIGFLYNPAIKCVHNDYITDLGRFCLMQRRVNHDGVLFCAKRPEIHGEFEVLRANRPVSRGDGPALAMKKGMKTALAQDWLLRLWPSVVTAAEHLRLPDAVLFRLYRAVSSLHVLRGVREGLEEVRRRKGDEAADRLGRRTHA